MTIFSKYDAVLEADGEPMSVHDVLVHINRAIDGQFANTEEDLDADTLFYDWWFDRVVEVAGIEPAS